MAKTKDILTISLTLADGNEVKAELREPYKGDATVESIMVDYDNNVVVISIENERIVDEEIYPLTFIKKIAYTKERLGSTYKVA